MRKTLTISLPSKMVTQVRRDAKAEGATISEYFRKLLRREELVRQIEQSEAEIAAGKGKILRSFKDLR